MTTRFGQGQRGPASLRERKKARTRASLREHALRLFRERGYQATTVEQIAAAAEVSPSTFFRYFPTKEDLVLQDDMDTRMMEALAGQPAGLAPITAVRAAVRESWASFTEAEWELLRQSATLSMQVPEIRSRMMNEVARSSSVITDALAERTGLPRDDLRIRVLAGAILGVMMTTFLPEKLATETDPDDVDYQWMGPDSVNRIDEALALLEAGLPLD
jgi:AcrR family transcriptional regulator